MLQELCVLTKKMERPLGSGLSTSYQSCEVPCPYFKLFFMYFMVPIMIWKHYFHKLFALPTDPESGPDSWIRIRLNLDQRHHFESSLAAFSSTYHPAISSCQMLCFKECYGSALVSMRTRIRIQHIWSSQIQIQVFMTKIKEKIYSWKNYIFLYQKLQFSYL